jgi:signal transduction histidine kinase
VTDHLPERLPSTVAMTAYLVAVDGVADAARRGATGVDVVLEMADNRMVLRLADDAARAPAVVPHLEDRVIAVGGTLAVLPTDVRVDIPCG